MATQNNKIRYKSRKETTDPITYGSIATVTIDNGTTSREETAYYSGDMGDSLADCRRKAKDKLKKTVSPWTIH